MFYVLMILLILIGVMMTLTILMQNPKGGGLSSAFGGASVGSMLGVRHASDILAKTTWGLSIAFVVIIFMVNLFFLPSEGTRQSVIRGVESQQPVTPMQGAQQMQQQAQPAQQQPAQQQAQPAQQPAQQPAPQTPAQGGQ